MTATLPNGWTSLTLGEIGKWGSGGTPSRSNSSFYIGSIPWFKTGELGPRVIYKSEESISEEAIKASSAKIFPAGSIALAMYGATIGKTSILGVDAATNQACAVVVEDNQIVNKSYLFNYLKLQKDRFIAAGQGGAQPNISQTVIKAWPIPLAPLQEQHRIAEKLDTTLARVDALNDRLARITPLLKRFRQSVLAAATSGRLTEDWRCTNSLTTPWVTTEIQHVAKVGTGSTPLRSNPDFFAAEGTPWITSSATSQDVIKAADEYVTEAAINAHRLKIYTVGTLLVAMYGEGKTRGQVSELGIAATINQACAAIVVDQQKINKNFLKLSLQANYLEMRILAEGGNQPNLNLSKIKGFLVDLPSMKEQTEIVRRVETLFAFADRLEARLQSAQTAAERLTPALLAKAFRGELVPQDPNDEPATELLRRLREARAAEAPTKPKRGRKAAAS